MEPFRASQVLKREARRSGLGRGGREWTSVARFFSLRRCSGAECIRHGLTNVRRMKRLLVGALAFAALALALYNAVSPERRGSLGMYIQPGGAVTAVVAGGPAARAGIKRGDRIDDYGVPLNLRIANLAARAGQSFEVPVERSGARHMIAVRAEAEPLGFFSIGRYIDLALTILYVFFGFIVLLKAARTPLSTLLTWMMMVWALTNGCADYQQTAPDSLSAFFVSSVLLAVLCAIFAAMIVRAIAALPVGMPMLRGRLAKYSPALGIMNAGLFFPEPLAIVLPAASSPIIILPILIVSFAYGLVAAILTLVLVRTASPEQRVRARWFASSLVLCWFLDLSLFVANLFIGNATLFIVLYYVLSFALVGPVYATLRHRLVDLDVILSRSAVFGVVSLALLTAFVGAEWLASKVADAVVGQGRWHGITTQLLSFGVAIAVGLYVRHLHSHVEGRINALLFRDRMRKLRLLESFAHEADLIDSRRALLNVAFEAMVESLDTADISIYISDGRSFACIRTSNPSAPERLDKTDRLILQLLHRPEPYQSEVPTLRHWLIFRLAVRAEVIGFLACGVKRDHTVYLPEELRALSTIAHHMATSYALLTDSVLAQ